MGIIDDPSYTSRLHTGDEVHEAVLKTTMITVMMLAEVRNLDDASALYGLVRVVHNGGNLTALAIKRLSALELCDDVGMIHTDVTRVVSAITRIEDNGCTVVLRNAFTGSDARWVRLM